MSNSPLSTALVKATMPEVNTSPGPSSRAATILYRAYHIGNQPAHLLIIPNIIARQLTIRPRELGVAHFRITLVELLWV